MFCSTDNVEFLVTVHSWPSCVHGGLACQVLGKLLHSCSVQQNRHPLAATLFCLPSASDTEYVPLAFSGKSLMVGEMQKTIQQSLNR